MKILVVFIMFCASTAVCYSQNTEAGEEKWGVVLSHPRQQYTKIVADIRYSDSCLPCVLNIYLPPNSGSLPVVIFLPEMTKNRSWIAYRSWGKLAAAYGFVAITPDVDTDNYLSSVQSLLKFIRNQNGILPVDRNKIALYITSHIPGNVVEFLLKSTAYPEIKTVSLLYHNPQLNGPFRRDLPVLYIGDDQVNFTSDRYTHLWNEVQKSKAPWSMHFAAGRPHFFDLYDESEESRRLVRYMISWWQIQLETNPSEKDTNNPDREMIANLYRADYKTAADQLRKWLEQHPNDQYANSKFAMISLMEGKFIEAERAYRHINELHPVNMIDFAKVLLALNKDTEADTWVDKALESGQVRRNPFGSIGEFLYSIEKYKKGLKYFERALQSDSSNTFFYQMGYGKAALGEVDDAINFLYKAVSRGYANREKLLNEEVFSVVRRDERFSDILEKMNRH